MSKVVKAVAVGALVGLTGGAALGFLAPALVGGSITVAGGVFGSVATISATTVGAVSGAVLGAVQGGLSAAASMFVDKPSMDMGEAQARLNVALDPNAFGKWVFGETAMATDLVYAENYQDTKLVQVMACAAHEITEFRELYIDDEQISFSGNAATGDWAGVLTQETNLGTSTQVHLSGLGSWPTDAEGAGIAHFGFEWTVGEDKIRNGIPTRITQVGKGAAVYDPRLDSTRGGSGTHRADDQSTWEYNDGTTDIGANWALIVTFYLLGWRENGELIFGVGVDPDDVDWDSVIAAANVCDETQDGKPRFHIGGVFPATNDHEAIMAQLEAAIGGKIARVSGKYYLWAPNDDLTSVGEITEDLILREAGVEFTPSGPISGLYNTARGRYISRSDLYQPAPYPEVIESTAVTEDGRTRLKDHDFSVVQDVEVAERVARYLVRRSRFSGTWRLATGPVGLLYQPFSVITLNLQETNNQDTLVRITDMDIRPDGVVVMELLEEDSSIYDQTEPLGTPITQLDPSAHDPSEAIALTGLAVTATTYQGSNRSASNAFRVTWDDPGGYVERTEVQYRIDGDTNWTPAPPPRVDFTDAVIGPLEGGTTYDVRARHITAFGVAGAWISTQQTATDAAEYPYGRVQDPIAGQNLLPVGSTGEFTDSSIGGWDKRYFGATGIALTELDLDGSDIVSAGVDLKTAGDHEGSLAILWFDGSGTELDREQTSFVDTGGAWQRLELANLTIPETVGGTAVKRVGFHLDDLNAATTGSNTWRRPMFNRGPKALPYEAPPARVQRSEVEENATVGAEATVNFTTVYSDGAGFVVEAPIERSMTGSTFTKLKAFRLYGTGTIRFEAELQSSGAGVGDNVDIQFRQGATVLSDTAAVGGYFTSGAWQIVSFTVTLDNAEDVVDAYINHINGGTAKIRDAAIYSTASAGESATLD